MIKIKFKDVGQGDSILLQWLNADNKLQIGLIDCNKKGISNPVLDEIKLLRDYEFNFVILSHPHEDHFSGLPELLEHVEHRGIQLKYFFHTCPSNKEYLRAAVTSVTSQKLLFSIFQKVSSLHKSGLIENYGFVNNLTGEITLDDSIKLKFLYPDDSLYQKYNRTAFKNEDISENNPNANFLSTVIKIYTSDWSILFTSDAHFEVFFQINREGYKELKTNLLLGQIPHHGAKGNYYDTFWRSINHNSQPFACISVGENFYGHPSDDVITKLQTHQYYVEATMGLSNNISILETFTLDIFSTVVSGGVSTSRDLTYIVKDNQVHAQ